MKLNSFKIRSSLWGTTALAITSILFCMTLGCGQDKMDTDNLGNPPPIVSEVSTTWIASTTTSTATTSSTSTSTTSTITTTTTAETTLMIQPTTVIPTTAVVIEPITEWVEPEPVEIISTAPITEYERVLLCNIVANEAGSDWISIYDKACVVACVMNRVNSPDFPNTIEGVLTQPYQFSGYYASGSYYSTVTDACIQAVDYYFNNPNEFGYWLYFEGNGTNNYFH